MRGRDGTRTGREALGRLLPVALIAVVCLHGTAGVAVGAVVTTGSPNSHAGAGPAGSGAGHAGFSLPQSSSYPWDNQTVESTGDVGMYADVAIDSDGDPHVVYMDWSSSDLKYAERVGGTWQVQTVRSQGRVGQDASLALDASGHPHIAYHDQGNGYLRYAEWDGSRWDHRIVDASGSVGEDTDIALGPNGQPHVSYYHAGNQNLAVAERTTSGWTIRTAAYGRNVGQYSSIAVSSSGDARVAYYDAHGDDLEYAEESSGSWTSITMDASGDVGRYTDIALDSRGDVHVSYYDWTSGDLKHAEKIHGTGITTETVTASGDVGMYSSIAVDGTGTVHVAARDWTSGGLTYAHEDGNSWQTQLVTDTGDVGAYATLALDSHGTPVIAHYNWTTNDLELEEQVRPPTAPQSLSATASNGQASLSWAAPAYDGRDSVDSYRVYRASGSGSLQQVATLAGSSTSYTDTSVSNGQQYTYEVRAANLAGEGTASSRVTATPQGPPSAPRTLVRGVGDEQVNLSWSPPSSTNGAPIAGYVIFRGTSPGALQQVATTTSTGYNDTGLTNGQQYFYEVRAQNAVGTGPASTRIRATPQGEPSAPRSLQTLLSLSGDRVTLSWQAPASNGGAQLVEYRVYRASGSGFQQVATVSGTTSYRDTTVVTGQQYRYAVTAVNAVGEGQPSQPVSVTPVSPPDEPANLQVTAGDEEVTLEWDAPRDTGGTAITHYRVYRTGPSGNRVQVGSPTTTSFTDVGLTNGQEYAYEVIAVNSAGFLTSGATANATPRTTPDAPRDVGASLVDGRVTITWSAPRDNGGARLTGYEVYRTGGDGRTQVASVTSTQFQAVDGDVEPGTDYEYHVRAVNVAGPGNDSAAASVSVPEQRVESDESAAGSDDRQGNRDESSDDGTTAAAADDTGSGPSESDQPSQSPGGSGTVSQTILGGLVAALLGGLGLAGVLAYRSGRLDRSSTGN